MSQNGFPEYDNTEKTIFWRPLRLRAPTAWLLILSGRFVIATIKRQ